MAPIESSATLRLTFRATRWRTSIEGRFASLPRLSQTSSEFSINSTRCSPHGPSLPDNRPFTVLSLALVHLINFLVACDEPFNSILRASDTATEYQVRVKRSLLRSI